MKTILSLSFAASLASHAFAADPTAAARLEMKTGRSTRQAVSAKTQCSMGGACCRSARAIAESSESSRYLSAKLGLTAAPPSLAANSHSNPAPVSGTGFVLAKLGRAASPAPLATTTSTPTVTASLDHCAMPSCCD